MKVLLIAGEPAFRLGFRKAIETSRDLQLVADVGDARSGFRCIDAEKPAVVAIDVSLPGMNGITATREVMRRAPGVAVVLLSSWARERDALDGQAAGARGFILKTDPLELLLCAIQSVGDGHCYVTPVLREFVLGVVDRKGKRHAGGEEGGVLDVLSPREREVLELVLRGWHNQPIAKELCVSVKTIDTHRTRINRKLRCSGALDLFRFAADNGLLRTAPSAPEAAGFVPSNGRPVADPAASLMVDQVL